VAYPNVDATGDRLRVVRTGAVSLERLREVVPVDGPDEEPTDEAPTDEAPADVEPTETPSDEATTDETPTDVDRAETAG
jgi:L-threonylcarbamoyladenylate synthase